MYSLAIKAKRVMTNPNRKRFQYIGENHAYGQLAGFPPLKYQNVLARRLGFLRK